MGKLNLDTFNEILLGALKDGSPQGKLEMLKAELEMVNNVFFSIVPEVLDELEANGYKSENFTKLCNVKANGEKLIKQIQELEEEINGTEQKESNS